VNCIVTDYVEPDLEWEATQYASQGVSFQALQLRTAWEAEVIARVCEADVLVVDQTPISAAIIEAMPNCKLIIRHGDGYDNLDLEAATKHGIACANKPGFWSREVAEHALGLSLALSLRLTDQQRVAANSHTLAATAWDLSRAMPQHSISGWTCGVVGFGKIGTRVTDYLRRLCSRVVVCDPYVSPDVIHAEGAESVGIDELLGVSDLVTLHVPATEETIGFMDSNRIGAMKPGAMLVNTARGSIVRTEDVVDALRSGRLGGVALDVTNPEPLPPEHPLFSLPNVIVTPHLGWYSEEALWSMRKSIVQDVLRAADGKLPSTIVNPEVLSRGNLRIGQAKSESGKEGRDE